MIVLDPRCRGNCYSDFIPKIAVLLLLAYISLMCIFNLHNLKVHSHEIPMAILCTPRNYSVAKRTS